MRGTCVLLLLLGLIGCAKREPDSGESQKTGNPRTGVTAGRPDRVPLFYLEDVGHVYRDNETQADEMYKDKWLRLTVTPVGPVVRNKTGTATLHALSAFEPRGEWDTAFEFAAGSDAEAAQIEKGKPVTLEAICVGKKPLDGGGHIIGFKDTRVVK